MGRSFRARLQGKRAPGETAPFQRSENPIAGGRLFIGLGMECFPGRFHFFRSTSADVRSAVSQLTWLRDGGHSAAKALRQTSSKDRTKKEQRYWGVKIRQRHR